MATVWRQLSDLLDASLSDTPVEAARDIGLQVQAAEKEDLEREDGLADRLVPKAKHDARQAPLVGAGGG